MPRGRPRRERVSIEDVRILISRLHIENWKSIEMLDLEIREGVNLLVGANAAGKTNILEAVYFLYKALVEAFQRIPYVSHTPEYWSGLDLVYGKDRSRHVVLGLGIEQYARATGTNCRRWMRSGLDYRVYLEHDQSRDTLVPVRHEYRLNGDTILVIEEDALRVRVEGGLAERLSRTSHASLMVREGFREEPQGEGRAYTYTARLPEPVRPVPPLMTEIVYTRRLDRALRVALVDLIPYPYPVKLPPVPVWAYLKCSPSARGESALSSWMPWMLFRGRPGFPTVLHLAASLGRILGRVILLKHPDVGALGEPRRFQGEDRLDPRARNLPSVMITLRSRKGGKLPILDYAIGKGFPGLTVRPETGPGGSVYLVGEERGLTLPPPNLPDGLIKLVAIALALESRPSILLIDEVENSMHAGLLQLVYDMLESTGIPVLAATHSPLTIDLVRPEKIIVVERRDGRTVAERIRDAERLSSWLEEQGITLSDHVIYGLTMPGEGGGVRD